ncbi:MAG: sigma 54-interacting transcriptional regulator, partial [bacterium]|nr:sigma 54-interacting transcriptional regulator [bacterium]
LFLDEIGEMSPGTQVKILRAIEERQFRRLGGKNEIQVDVRIIAATNRDLLTAVREGQLREDLYYRLCVVEIELPPLRERLDDIPLLIEEFIKLYNQKNQKNISGLTQQCYDLLMRHSWPGNVRELKNTIERAVILTNTSKIDFDAIPDRIRDSVESSTSATMNSIETVASSDAIIIPFGSTMEDVERMVLLKTLEKVNNNKTKAAKLLGMSLKTIHNKLNKYKV